MLTLLAIGIVGAAFFSESIFGFGGGLVAIPLLSLLFGVRDAVSLILVFGLLMGFLIIGSYKHIHWKFAWPLTIGLFIGVLAGTWALAVSSEVVLRYVLASAILLFLCKSIFFEKFNFGTHTQARWGVLAGLLGGLLQGLIGTGGPIFTMYLVAGEADKLAFRATLIYVFFIANVVRLFVAIPTGLLNVRVLELALPIVPFFLIAIAAGHFVHKKIEERHYKLAIYVILFLSALGILWSAITGS